MQRTAIAVVLLAGCSLPPVTPPRLGHHDLPRVAVLPFRAGASLAPGGDFVAADPAWADGEPFSAARALAGHLARLGVSVVEVDRVAGVTERVASGRYGPDLARRVGERVGAGATVLGSLTRFVQREGTAWAVRTPASVEYQLVLVRSDGIVLATDRFAYTQQALTENLLQLPRFLRGGGRWLTREEVLEGALGESAERLVAALRAGRAAR